LDRYSGLVAGAIGAQGVSVPDVEDLAQQTFINAYKGLAGFRGDSRLSSWLYRIAINTARAHLKRLAARPAVHSMEEQAEAGQELADRRPGDSGRHAQDRALTAALAQLTAPQRMCIRLFYFEDLSYEEIAEATSIPFN